MKKINIYILGILIALFSSCESDIEMIHIQEGTPSEIVSDADPNTPVTLLKEDEQNVVYNLNWTIANYLGEDAVSSVKGEYIIEMSTSADFSNAVTLHPPEYLTHAFIAGELNLILIEQLGALPLEPIEAFFRIESTFNKDMLNSNTISNTFIPYRLVELPAVYLPPGDIYLWGAAVGAPWPFREEDKFTKETETVYTKVAYLPANTEYEILPYNSWAQKYTIPSDVVPSEVASAGTFIEDGDQAHDQFGNEVSRWEGQNAVSPAEAGIYTITLDFQTGTYTVTPGAKPAVYLPPGDIYLWGEAVGAPWPFAEEDKFTKESETLYSIVKDLPGNTAYEILPFNSWDQKYTIPADVVPSEVATAGTFIEDGDKAHDELGNEVSRWEGQNAVTPPEDATYKITLNFLTGTYTVVKQ